MTVAEWAQAKGFVATEGVAGAWETAWPHDSGYGYVTLRFFPIDGGNYWVIVETDREHGVNLGTCNTDVDARELYDVLIRRQYQR